jgi:26S proteasome regulatory subunit N1
MRIQIKDSTSSMTSIPKALKFLRAHQAKLVAVYECMGDAGNKRFLADILSVLAMTVGRETSNEVLKYCLLGQNEPVASWGHEYVRHLALELADERSKRVSTGGSDDELVPLALELCRFFLAHNAEPDACDLLMELERLDLIVGLLEGGQDYGRVCLYLQSCVPFEAVVDDQTVLQVVHRIYRQAGDLPMALTVALRINDRAMVQADFEAAADPLVQKQLAFMLARQRVLVPTADEQLAAIMSNTFLTDQFRELGKELEILEPKVPEDIYKSHLADALKIIVPSPRQHLASSFVNAMVNAGFCTDRLLTSDEVIADDNLSWTHKTKEHGLLSTIASIGLVNLWNADIGLAQLDRYMYSENKWTKAGAILGIGLVHTGIRNDADPAWALLREYLESDPDPTVKAAALMGLALAYGASARPDIAPTLLPFVADDDMSVAGMAALALGHLFVGTCDGDIASAILQTMMERAPADLASPHARFFSLGLALLFLGKQEGEADAVLETLRVIEHPIAHDTAVLVTVCAYAGTGNVLKVQELLKLCTIEPRPEGDETAATDNAALSYAVIGVGMLSMAEDIGREMSLRIFNHLMHFGDHNIRQAVPLAIGLLHASNPTIAVTELLSKYSHDAEKAVAINAIFAMGLVAAGTNNAKMAQMLRQLGAYYQKDADCLFMVRIAQGLVHMGKGTMTVNPIHAHRSLLAPVSMAGLLTVLVAFTDAQHLVMDKHTHLLYFLAASIYPRFLITMDDSLRPVPLLVRVGQAVEVVAQAGKPKTITGFQTHAAPVLIAAAERAELATEEYISVTPILEGFVLVKRNPEWVDDTPKKQ